MGTTEVAIIFIRNSAGDLFVHQRLASKKAFPNKYGIGAGGHVDPGETPHAAAQRELKEETNLETPVSFICTVEFDEPSFQQISHLFITAAEGDILNDKTEWQTSGWMTREQVDGLALRGELCTDTAEMYRRYSLV